MKKNWIALLFFVFGFLAVWLGPSQKTWAAVEYNLLDNAQQAVWAGWFANSMVDVTFGKDDYSKGVARYLFKDTTEDGQLHSRLLQVHPPLQDNAGTAGDFRNIQVPSGARLHLVYGFLSGTTKSDGVRVKVLVCLSAPGNPIHTLSDEKKIIDNRMTDISLDLSQFAGQTINIGLDVSNVSTSLQDWFVFTTAAIETGSPPATPSSLKATALSDTEIALNWQDNSNNEDGFVVLCSDQQSFEVDRVSANMTSYTVKGLEPGSTHGYWVRAYNSIGYSDYSNKTTITLPGPQQPAATVLKFYIGSNTYFNGNASNQMDTAPVLNGGRTFLPIRYVAEPLGATVAWDESEDKVTINFQGKTLELWIGKNAANVNGQFKIIDPGNPNLTPFVVPPGRTMLPLRFIAENMGCNVEWNSILNEVKITYPM